jgi:solute carrier family 25 carnitine/acylcarnitine transporter 20/29
MAQALEEANVGLNETTKDLFSGAVGGIAQVLIGQPFDIIKVRLQTTSDYKGFLQRNPHPPDRNRRLRLRPVRRI